MTATDIFLIAFGICVGLVVDEVVKWWRGEE